GTKHNYIRGNRIGTNAAGTAALGNIHGVYVAAGASSNIILANLISGNRGDGIVLTDSETFHNSVEGNFIGTNALGTAAVPNGQYGRPILNGVVYNPYGESGVWIGNGASDNTIGGYTTAVENVISGNIGNGVTIVGTSTNFNLVAGNLIGTNAAGLAALPNANGV